MKYTKKFFYKIKHIPAMLGIGALTALPVACGDEKINIIEKESEPIIKRDTTYLPKPDTTYLDARDTVKINYQDTIKRYDVILAMSATVPDDKSHPTPELVKKLAASDTIANIFLVPPDTCLFTTLSRMHITRIEYLEPMLAISPKVHGRGNFQIPPHQIRTSDSLWYVANGWTINQK